MRSKIINMAETMKDAEDLMLEKLLGSETIADDGFSDRVVAKVRRRLWIRRLTLPVAAAIGTSIAAKPVLTLLESLRGLLETVIPAESAAVPALPSLPLLVGGGLLFLAVVAAVQLIED